MVVGVDGSPGSITALSWALKLAGKTGAGVEAVSAWEMWYAWIDQYAADIPRWEEEAKRDAGARLDAAIASALGGSTHEVAITRRVVEGGAAQVLLDASKGADLLVVGSRGRGGFKGLLLGSVSQQCVHHARIPVVVVPPPD